MSETAEDDFFSNARVAILGLGLMGGSLALALRGKCGELLGADPDPETRDLALEMGLVDRLSADPGEILPCAGVVILAAPVSAVLDLLQELPRLHPGTAVVLDLGSTKKQIVERMGQLPGRFDPLGGHPMCGKETSSLKNAEARLFQGAPFAFTPLERTTSHARAVGEAVARAAGALPVWLDADTHDRWVAATSHLPFLLSNLLARITPADAGPLVGPGFRSVSRLAVTPAAMMRDILMTNRTNVLEGLTRFRRELESLEQLLAAGEWEALAEGFELGAAKRRALVQGGPPAGARE